MTGRIEKRWRIYDGLRADAIRLLITFALSPVRQGEKVFGMRRAADYKLMRLIDSA